MKLTIQRNFMQIVLRNKPDKIKNFTEIEFIVFQKEEVQLNKEKQPK